jgi:hypothetical protein
MGAVSGCSGEVVYVSMEAQTNRLETRVGSEFPRRTTVPETAPEKMGSNARMQWGWCVRYRIDKTRHHQTVSEPLVTLQHNKPSQNKQV